MDLRNLQRKKDIFQFRLFIWRAKKYNLWWFRNSQHQKPEETHLGQHDRQRLHRVCLFSYDAATSGKRRWLSHLVRKSFVGDRHQRKCVCVYIRERDGRIKLSSWRPFLPLFLFRKQTFKPLLYPSTSEVLLPPPFYIFKNFVIVCMCVTERKRGT